MYLSPFSLIRPSYEARPTESVKKGEAIRWSQVQIPSDSFVLKLYRQQEATFR